MRRALPYFAGAVLLLLGSYVIAFHGFDAVVKNVVEQSLYQQENEIRLGRRIPKALLAL